MLPFRTPRRAVVALFMLNGAFAGVWASRLPAIADIYDLSPSRLGLVLLCMAIGAISSFAFAGRLADRFGAAQVSRVLAVAYGCCLALLPHAPNAPTLAFGLLFFGAAFGALDVTMNVWATEVEKAHRRPIMSSFHAMFSLGAGLGAVTGYAAIHAGWGVGLHFFVTALGLTVLALSMTLIPWDSQRAAATKATIFALPKGTLVLVGLMTLAAAMGEGAMMDWSAIFLHSTIGVTEAQATFGFWGFSLAMVAARLSGDTLIRLFGPVRVAQISGLAAVLGIAIVVISPTMPLAVTGFVLMGFGYAPIFPMAFSRAALDPLLSPGRAIAAVATLGYGGFLIGPPLIGFLADLTSLRIAIGVLAALALMIVAFAAHLRAPNPV